MSSGHGGGFVVGDDDGDVGVSLTQSSSPVMPEWVKVESPMTATAGCRPASEAPFAMVMEAPLSTQELMALNGALAPSV